MVALGAAAILLTAQHIFISSSDVRAEACLTALVIGGVYHFYEASRLNNHVHLVAGSVLTAAAVMTKGIFVLIPIGGAIAGGLLLDRQWTRAFHVRWLAAILLIFLFISPELISLWRQFDAHPEKSVFGRTGVSGLRFFFWDSQFGRFFNTGPIRGHGNPFQYFEVVLWAFLPWSVPLIAATFDQVRSLVGRKPQTAEYFNLSGGLLTFLLFSASQFQLPHYLNVAFPFFAIMTSAYILGPSTATTDRLARIWQSLFVGGVLIVCLALQLIVQPGHWAGPAALLAITVALSLYLQKKPWEHPRVRLIVTLASVNIFANLYFNGTIVPALMKYQAGSEMAFYANEQYPGRPVVQLNNAYSYAMEFYLKAPVTAVDVSMLREGRLPEGTLVYAPAGVLRPLIGKFRLLHRTSSYRVSRPTLPFLNAATRERTLGESWLVQAEEHRQN